MNELVVAKEIAQGLLATIDGSMEQIRAIETIEEAKHTADGIRDFDTLLKTQRVQEALGDKLAEAKQKVAQLVIEIKTKISELAKQSADDTLKQRAYERAGIRKEEVPAIEIAAQMPIAHKQEYLAAKSNEGTLPTIKEMASLQRLPEREKTKAFATIGDIARRPMSERPRFTPTVSATIKHAEAKIAKDWTPKAPGAPVAAKKPELPDTYYPAVQILTLGNQLHTKTTALMVCARRLTEPGDSVTGVMMSKKELGELSDALESKLRELDGVAKEAIGAARKLAGEFASGSVANETQEALA